MKIKNSSVYFGKQERTIDFMMHASGMEEFTAKGL
jgi:hypothetical protein